MEDIKHSNKKRWFALFMAVVTFTLWFFIQFDWGHQVAANLVNKDIEKTNLAYLAREEQASRDVLIKLAEVYTFLEVIRSSDVGVSFLIDINVEVGNLVTSLSRAVDRGMIVSTIAMSSSIILKTLVKLASDISPFLFKSSLLFLSILFLNMALFNKFILTTLSEACFKTFALLLIVTHLVIPYSIHATELIAHLAIKDLKIENQKHIEDVYQNNSVPQRKGDLKDRAEGSLHLFEKKLTHLPQSIEKTTLFLTYHLALFLIEGIFLPIALLVGFGLGAKRLFTWSRAELNLV